MTTEEVEDGEEASLGEGKEEVDEGKEEDEASPVSQPTKLGEDVWTMPCVFSWETRADARSV